MSEFVDTNILCYAHDVSAGRKHDVSTDLLERLFLEKTGALSIQVLVEFYAVVTRKFHATSQVAEEAIEGYSLFRIHRPDYSSIVAAIHCQRRHKLAWYDAMVLNSAIEMGCSVLWSEDFSDGQRFSNLVVRNPFKHSRIV
jgi:predicted nucleic acid-binding protein